MGKPPGAKTSAGELGGSPASRSIHEVAAIFVPKPMQHQTRRLLIKIHLGKILVLIILNLLLFHIRQDLSKNTFLAKCTGNAFNLLPQSELVGISSKVPYKSANATKRGWRLADCYFCSNDSLAGGFVCQGQERFERFE